MKSKRERNQNITKFANNDIISKQYNEKETHTHTHTNTLARIYTHMRAHIYLYINIYTYVLYPVFKMHLCEYCLGIKLSISLTLSLSLSLSLSLYMIGFSNERSSFASGCLISCFPYNKVNLASIYLSIYLSIKLWLYMLKCHKYVHK